MVDLIDKTEWDRRVGEMKVGGFKAAIAYAAIVAVAEGALEALKPKPATTEAKDGVRGSR